MKNENKSRFQPNISNSSKLLNKIEMYTMYKVQLSSYGYIDTKELIQVESMTFLTPQNVLEPLGASLQAYPSSSLAHSPK